MKVTRLSRIGPKFNPHHFHTSGLLEVKPAAVRQLGKPLRNVPNGAKGVGFKSRVGWWGSRHAGDVGGLPAAAHA